MKTNPSQTLNPSVGHCYRLNFVRAGHATSHLVLVLAAAGEWCTILDLQAHGQPNPAGCESLRWTNPHVHFAPLPVSEWPLAAYQGAVAAGLVAPTRRAASACRSALRSHAAAARRTAPRSASRTGRAEPVSSAADVVVLVA